MESGCWGTAKLLGSPRACKTDLSCILKKNDDEGKLAFLLRSSNDLRPLLSIISEKYVHITHFYNPLPRLNGMWHCFVIECRIKIGLTYQAKLNCVLSEAVVDSVRCRTSRGRSMKEMWYISKSVEPNPPLQSALAEFCLFPSWFLTFPNTFRSNTLHFTPIIRGNWVHAFFFPGF